MSFIPPKTLREWVNDIPDGDLYIVYVTDQNTVVSACGRYAHSSGSSSATIEEFINGKLQMVIEETMGREVLNEVIEFVQHN